MTLVLFWAIILSSLENPKTGGCKMLWFAMILGAVGIVFLIIAGSIAESPDAENKDSVLAIRLGAIGGLLFGIFIVGTFMARANAGRPITEFRDGNIYMLVSFSEIVDDQKTVVVGLRKIQDGRWWSLTSKNMKLRMYRLPVGMLSASGVSRKPPYYLKFIKTGDCTSFEVYQKNPLPKGK